MSRTIQAIVGLIIAVIAIAIALYKVTSALGS